MSVTEYKFYDPATNLAWRTGSMDPSPVTTLVFPFGFDTPGLPTGVPLVKLPAGSLIYDIGISVPTVFDGTTPLADVGTFTGSNNGLFHGEGGAIDLTVADSSNAGSPELATPGEDAWFSTATYGTDTVRGSVYVVQTAQLKLVVSQTGAKGGAAIGATFGEGAVYLLVSTPPVS
jgi:hypothetical protein